MPHILQNTVNKNTFVPCSLVDCKHHIHCPIIVFLQQLLPADHRTVRWITSKKLHSLRNTTTSISHYLYWFSKIWTFNWDGNLTRWNTSLFGHTTTLTICLAGKTMQYRTYNHTHAHNNTMAHASTLPPTAIIKKQNDHLSCSVNVDS